MWMTATQAQPRPGKSGLDDPNSLNARTKNTIETPGTDGGILFLDT